MSASELVIKDTSVNMEKKAINHITKYAINAVRWIEKVNIMNFSSRIMYIANFTGIP